MDAVVVAQAFHWFDPRRALPEIAGPAARGRLALIWNERDESIPSSPSWSASANGICARPYPMGKDFGTVVDTSGLFGPVERRETAFVQLLDLGGVRRPGGIPELRPGAAR